MSTSELIRNFSKGNMESFNISAKQYSWLKSVSEQESTQIRNLTFSSQDNSIYIEYDSKTIYKMSEVHSSNQYIRVFRCTAYSFAVPIKSNNNSVIFERRQDINKELFKIVSRTQINQTNPK